MISNYAVASFFRKPLDFCVFFLYFCLYSSKIDDVKACPRMVMYNSTILLKMFRLMFSSILDDNDFHHGSKSSWVITAFKRVRLLLSLSRVAVCTLKCLRLPP